MAGVKQAEELALLISLSLELKHESKPLNRSLLSVSSIRKTTTIAVVFLIALTKTML